MGLQSIKPPFARLRQSAKWGRMKLAIVASSVLATLLLVSTPVSAADSVLAREIGLRLQPVVSGVASSSVVSPGDWVVIQGSGFDQVIKVFVDSTQTEFLMQSATRISVLIPEGANPGDAVLRLQGDYGSISKQYLFEVLADSPEASNIGAEAKVTIGTFQGYAAVYTKNFKGHSLRISIGDRERFIDQLDSDYTQNLTKIGVGRTVNVMVYLGNKLVKVQRLLIL